MTMDSYADTICHRFICRRICTPEEPGKTQALGNCPLHSKGGMRLRQTWYLYPRQTPQGTRIARWYCPDGHSTFSLLPDCLSSRLPGSLIDVETAINKAENAPSQEAAVHTIFGSISVLPAFCAGSDAELFLVRTTLTLLTRVPSCSFLKIASPAFQRLRSALGVEYVLPALADVMQSPICIFYLAPIGFGPLPQRKRDKKTAFQHKTGTDPPLNKRINCLQSQYEGGNCNEKPAQRSSMFGNTTCSTAPVYLPGSQQKCSSQSEKR